MGFILKTQVFRHVKTYQKTLLPLLRCGINNFPLIFISTKFHFADTRGRSNLTYFLKTQIAVPANSVLAFQG